jgi:FKBP-type peptidyl-prolyl cis-trans isomerase FkpA
MRWFNKLTSGLLAAMTLAGCGGPAEVKTSSGLALQVYQRQPDVRKVQTGDWVTLHFWQRTLKGDTITNTFAQGKPIAHQVLPPPYPKAIEEVLLALQMGDSAVFTVAAADYYQQGQALPPPVTAQDQLQFGLKVVNVQSEGERRVALQAEAEAQIPVEEAQIQAHLKEREIEGSTKRHPSGLYYFEHWAGKGQPADPGDSIVFFLNATYLNGNTFDLHDKTPLSFVLGRNRVLPGWEIAFNDILTEGSQYSIILPSRLAYGAKGKDLIQPFTPLRFQIGVKQIVRAQDLARYRQGKRP